MTELAKPDLEQLLNLWDVDTSYLSHTGWSPRKIRCVIHEDRNPSMTVNLETGHAKCWSCGAGGDAYDLIQQKLGIESLPEAKRWAQEHLGVKIMANAGAAAKPARYRPSWASADDE